jgi:hypothetical protein
MQLRSEGAAKVKELKWRQDELRHQSEKRRIQRVNTIKTLYPPRAHHLLLRLAFFRGSKLGPELPQIPT